MIENSMILDFIEDNKSEAIRLRHHFHAYPELSTQEIETTRVLREYVTQLGYHVEPIPADSRSNGTGFIATLDTGTPGPTIGLRTDIDALPVYETPNNLVQERVVCSEYEGVMHACGHDAHMTTLLIAAKFFSEHRRELKGKIVLIFEEAEETGDGIDAMIDYLQDVPMDVIYGNHMTSFMNVGDISCDPGPVMAAVSIVHFDIIGHGGHGSRPDLSINPLFVGTDILNSVSIAWNNQLNVEETVTLGITKFNCGEALNVFSDTATIGGTLRYFNNDEGIKAYHLFMSIAENVAASHQCRIVEKPFSGPTQTPVINDKTTARMVQKSVNSLFPGHLIEDQRWYASESFSKYQDLAPTAFSFIGIKDAAFGSGAEHHNAYFDLPDESLQYSIGTMIKFVMDYLSNPN